MQFTLHTYVTHAINAYGRHLNHLTTFHPMPQIEISAACSSNLQVAICLQPAAPFVPVVAETLQYQWKLKKFLERRHKMPLPQSNPSTSKVAARRGIQILIRQQGGDVERSIYMCQPDITFGDLFQEIKLKRSKSYSCSAVHVTGEIPHSREYCQSSHCFA